MQLAIYQTADHPTVESFCQRRPNTCEEHLRPSLGTP